MGVVICYWFYGLTFWCAACFWLSCIRWCLLPWIRGSSCTKLTLLFLFPKIYFGKLKLRLQLNNSDPSSLYIVWLDFNGCCFNCGSISYIALIRIHRFLPKNDPRLVYRERRVPHTRDPSYLFTYRGYFGHQIRIRHVTYNNPDPIISTTIWPTIGI